jgi:hypothetical protein
VGDGRRWQAGVERGRSRSASRSFARHSVDEGSGSFACRGADEGSPSFVSRGADDTALGRHWRDDLDDCRGARGLECGASATGASASDFDCRSWIEGREVDRRRVRRTRVIRHAVAMASVAVVLASAGIGRAQPAAQAPAVADARADALFTEGKELRDAGRYADACSKFAQSKELAPGVGVSLHLADCYERVGRTASAWREFRAAEKLAIEHADKRSEIAGSRAKALEAKLNRLTVQIAPAEGQGGVQLKVDGVSLPPESWNAALVIDPGDHVIVYAAPGQTPTTFTAHVDELTSDATVRVDGVHSDGTAASSAAPPAPAASEPPPAPAAPPADSSVAASPVAVPPAAEAATPSNDYANRRGTAYGLVAAGFVGIGVGAVLLAENTPSAPPGTRADLVRPNPDMTTGAAVAFAAAGIALVSAFVVYFTTPHAKDAKAAALLVSPTALPGGAGGFLSAAF